MQFISILYILILVGGNSSIKASEELEKGSIFSPPPFNNPKESDPHFKESISIRPLDWLTTGCSETNEIVRTKDWSTTSLGPIELWPSSLTNVLSLCFNANSPITVYWGPNYVVFYNDAFLPIMGDKHPQSLGQNARDATPEIWDIIEPIFEGVRKTGKPFSALDQLLPLKRFGYVEECYFHYNLSPIKIPDGTNEGILNIAVENTYRVLNERRQKFLRDLALETASAKSAGDVCVLAATIFDRKDIPFSLIYLIDPRNRQAHLAGSSGFQVNDPLIPDVVDLTEKENLLGTWPINIVAKTAMEQKIPDLFKHFGVTFSSYWPEATREALLLPIRISNQTGMFGVLVVGISPRRALDNDYRIFFGLVAGEIATAIVNARAYEEEKLHAKKLEELDRAKTVFFSNISHEFRTPLTLILDPLEDALADQSQPLPDCQFKRIEMVKRNAFRLLKLVNSLLDFSRIEAGRMQAQYVPTDLAKYTADLVSVFRSAIEKAGLILHVDMGSIEERVYIDKNSWEKIIFNLLSNALKFTFEGSITVTVKKCEERIELQVMDTGIGIPKQELPRMFERFHRIENVHGRSQEGTGIGLALTQELVKLHGGNIQIESEEGKGSVFTVFIPLGKAHLPPDHIHEETASKDSSSTLSVPFVEEALCWLPAEPKEGVQEKPIEGTMPPALVQPTIKEIVLLADDNSDMREYVRQLLSDYWKVYAVADGEAALQAARDINPALILSDVMMPKMDGFQLTQELRHDPRTALIPIILLSARAGEESSREGLQQGADDYMIKPFTADTLIDRVRAHMELGRLRIQLDKAVKERTHELQETIVELEETASALRKSEENYRILASISPAGIVHCDKEGEIFFMNEKANIMLGLTLENAQREKWTAVLHPEDKERVYTAWKDFTKRKTGRFKEEYRFLRPDGSILWVIGEAAAEKDDKDQVKSYVGTLTDISEVKELEKKRLEASQQLEEHQRKRVQEAESARKNLENFINMVCHEIRNPLMGAFGNISFLQDIAISLKSFGGRLSTEAQPMLRELLHKQDESIKQIEQCIKHQKAITDDVLDLSKLESGKATFVIQSVRLKTIIEEVAQIFTAPLTLKKLSLILELPETDPWVKTDANRLKMVLVNLVTNALKFTEEGHIKISLDILDVTPTHTTVALSVEDTGIGMTHEEEAQLFKRFIRVAATEYEGSGLGLLISKRFIESMGGRIDVKSQKGQGSQFIIQLTCESAEADKKPPPLITQEPAASLSALPTPKHILVVEDNLVNQLVLRRFLEKANYICEVANNGQEAIEKWSTSRPDLVLMDIEMPVMGGLEATRAIRERERQSPLVTRTPIVALSAYTSNEFITKARKVGMDDYISKPCGEEKVYSVIGRLTASQLEPSSFQKPPSDTLRAFEELSTTQVPEEKVDLEVLRDSGESFMYYRILMVLIILLSLVPSSC
jgi:PAS domain S-box-containing protein